MKCVRCGTELKENEKFCLGCGFEVGSSYKKKETSETLESLMEMPVEDDSAQEVELEVEELIVDETISYNEQIDGNIVNVTTNNVVEGELLPKTKKRKKYGAFLVLFFLVLCGVSVYIFVTYPKGDEPTIPIDIGKPNITNYPTNLYAFGNNFIIKINNKWTLLNDNKELGASESKHFEADGSTFTMSIYNYGKDHLNTYIKQKQLDVGYKEIKINDEIYYVFTFDNNKNYVKIVENYLYAFEFFYTTNIDNLIDEIIYNIIFYK